MKPTIAIIVQGGIVQNVVSDAPVNVAIIDHDVEGSEAHQTTTAEGVNTPVFLAHMEPELNPEFVKQFAEEDSLEVQP